MNYQVTFNPRVSKLQFSIQIQPVTCFCNSFLEHRHTPSLTQLSLCCSGELGGCDRQSTACRAQNIYHQALYRERFSTLVCSFSRDTEPQH